MAAAVPAASPVTAQAGMTRVMSHIASVTEISRPAAKRFGTFSVYKDTERQLKGRPTFPPITRHANTVRHMFLILGFIHCVCADETARHSDKRD